jgi:hypothetical protein
VASYSGENHTTWERVTVEVPQLHGVATARIRFRLETDSSVTRDGWHVDDIWCAPAAAVGELAFSDGFESGDTARGQHVPREDRGSRIWG